MSIKKRIWKQSKLVKWTSPFLVLLVIGLTVCTGQLLIVRAARLANTPSCSLVKAGSGDTMLQLDPSLDNDTLAKSLVDSNKYSLRCNVAGTATAKSNNYMVGLGTLNSCNTLAATGTNANNVREGESDGSDVSLTIPVNPCYNNSQTNSSNFQPLLLGSLTKNRLDNYCQRLLKTRQAVAAMDGQVAYGWQCHGGAANNGTRMPDLVMSNVCQVEFNRRDARDRLVYFWDTHPTSSFDPDSAWQCFANAKKLGNVTFDQLSAYCRSVGYINSELATVGTPTAYDYRCIGQGQKTSDRLDTFIGPCQLRYSQYKYVIDRLSNYYAPLSWECWTGM